MDTAGLRKYVHQQKAKGKSYEDIVQTLLHSGWNQQDILEALEDEHTSVSAQPLDVNAVPGFLKVVALFVFIYGLLSLFFAGFLIVLLFYAQVPPQIYALLGISTLITVASWFLAYGIIAMQAWALRAMVAYSVFVVMKSFFELYNGKVLSILPLLLFGYVMIRFLIESFSAREGSYLAQKIFWSAFAFIIVLFIGMLMIR